MPCGKDLLFVKIFALEENIMINNSENLYQDRIASFYQSPRSFFGGVKRNPIKDHDEYDNQFQENKIHRSTRPIFDEKVNSNTEPPLLTLIADIDDFTEIDNLESNPFKDQEEFDYESDKIDQLIAKKGYKALFNEHREFIGEFMSRFEWTMTALIDKNKPLSAKEKMYCKHLIDFMINNFYRSNNAMVITLRYFKTKDKLRPIAKYITEHVLHEKFF